MKSTNDQQTTENLIIIGGGPSGLSAAIYASRAGLKPLVIEGIPAGGQLMLTTEVENFPGFVKGIMGPELVAEMKKQAERFGTRFIQDNVQKIESGEKVKKVTVRGGAIYSAPVILVATGAEAQWLGLPSEQRLRGKGVSACATCDGFFFRNKTVAILGGGDSAMEEALVLTRFATKVYVIHRRDVFRASKIMQERVMNHPKIEVILNAQVEEILGEEKVTGIKYQTTTDNETRTVNVDGVFVAIGHRPATKFLEGSGVALDQKGYVLTSSKAALELVHAKLEIKDSKLISNFDLRYAYTTSVAGIFAAGDCVDHAYRQAITAAGMGVAAELEVEKYLEEINN